jgi:hypothetical protein
MARPCLRPAAACPPCGATHRPRAVAATSGLVGACPRPGGPARPADATRRAVCGGSGGARGRRPATGACACVRRRTGSRRGEAGRCSRRLSIHGASRGKTGGAPRGCAGQAGVGRSAPVGAQRRHHSVASSGHAPEAAGLPACDVEVWSWQSPFSCGPRSFAHGRHEQDKRVPLTRTDESREGRTLVGPTRLLPRSGFVQLSNIWKCFHEPIPLRCFPCYSALNFMRRAPWLGHSKG